MADNSDPSKPAMASRKARGQPRRTPQGRMRRQAVEAFDVLVREASREIVQAVINHAKAAPCSAPLVLKRIWPEQKSRRVAVDLPAVTDAAGVLEALRQDHRGHGEQAVTPDEGRALAGLLEAQRRAMRNPEAVQKARIAALEKRK